MGFSSMGIWEFHIQYEIWWMELSLDLGHRFSYVANLLMILSELFHILPQFLQKQNQAQNAIIVRRFKVLWWKHFSGGWWYYSSTHKYMCSWYWILLSIAVLRIQRFTLAQKWNSCLWGACNLFEELLVSLKKLLVGSSTPFWFTHWCYEDR